MSKAIRKAPAGAPNLMTVVTSTSSILTRSWGPFLAFVTCAATMGLIAIQLARTDAATYCITALVVVAICIGLIARMKRVF